MQPGGKTRDAAGARDGHREGGSRRGATPVTVAHLPFQRSFHADPALVCVHFDCGSLSAGSQSEGGRRTGLVVAGKYKIGRKLGSGSFGDIYHGDTLLMPACTAAVLWVHPF